MAKANPLRFSTKYQDDEADLVIYPRRPYSPSTGRWVTRDPAAERGGQNIYAFVSNGSGVDPLGLAELHYIEHPKWQLVNLDNVNNPLVSEFFWVGHYLTFDARDAGLLSGGSGFMVENERSEASITDCEGGNVVLQSRNLFFANKFSLSSSGSVITQSDPDEFEDGQLYLFTQMDSFSMPALYRKETKAQGEIKTKGWIHTRLEIHVYSSDAFELADPWISWMNPQGYSTADIDGHQMGRKRWGMMAAEPSSWSAGTVFKQTIDVDFKWDDCAAACGSGGGKTKWDYRITPNVFSQPGKQRARYVNDKRPAINLLTTPRNW